MAVSLNVVRAGPADGPRLLLIHGSAADHTTWTIQLASSLRDRFALIAYDRRGTGGSAAADRDGTATVETHADDAADLAAAEPGPVIAVGSSFGAVIALDLARRYPARVAGLVLCEPPMAPSDTAPTTPAGFHDRFDALVAEAGGEAAAEFFLRTVLGDTAYERMPRTFQARSKALWRAIRADSHALDAYRPRYAELGAVAALALLFGGERSAPYFRPTLDALAAALPAARLEVLPGAGHMLHAEAARTFNQRLAAFADERSAGR
jgi:pimeloyl-ACP methyl ester carboxylesterase